MGIESTLQAPCSHIITPWGSWFSFVENKFSQLQFGLIVTYKLSYIEALKKGSFLLNDKKKNHIV